MKTNEADQRQILARNMRKTRQGTSRSTRKPYLKLGLLGLGLLLVVALFYDLSHMDKYKKRNIIDPSSDIQRIILGMTAKPYHGPDGFFTMVAPAGWKIQVRPPDTGYLVAFYSPMGPAIQITVNPVEYNSFNTLLRRIRGVQERLGINMNLETNTFNGMSAVYRTTQLHKQLVLAIDFVTNNVAHEIEISIPNAFVEQYEPVLLDLCSTYHPMPVDGLRFLKAKP